MGFGNLNGANTGPSCSVTYGQYYVSVSRVIAKAFLTVAGEHCVNRHAAQSRALLRLCSTCSGDSRGGRPMRSPPALPRSCPDPAPILPQFDSQLAEST